MNPLVLAIEPDLRQAAIVKRIVREKVLADVNVVDSRDAAMEAIRTAVPDVLLLSALLSPRDEDELIAHLRSLDHAQHLQTHTIPQLASSIGSDDGESRGLLSAFRRKKSPKITAGCDPDLFAEEVRNYLRRASDLKRELEIAAAHAPFEKPVRPAARPAVAAETPAVDTGAGGSSWASPFEWRPANAPAPAAAARAPFAIAVPVAIATPVADPESHIPDPLIPDFAPPDSHLAPLDSHLAPPDSHLAPPDSYPAPLESPIAPQESLLAHLAPPDPHVAHREPLIASPEPLVASPEPYVASPEPYVAAPEPYVASPEPYVAAPEPYVAAPEPYVAAPEPYVAGTEAPVVQRVPAVMHPDWAVASALFAAASMTEDEEAPIKESILKALALPLEIASVSGAIGCHVRRLRVPVSSATA